MTVAVLGYFIICSIPFVFTGSAAYSIYQDRKKHKSDLETGGTRPLTLVANTPHILWHDAIGESEGLSDAAAEAQTTAPSAPPRRSDAASAAGTVRAVVEATALSRPSAGRGRGNPRPFGPRVRPTLPTAAGQQSSSMRYPRRAAFTFDEEEEEEEEEGEEDTSRRTLSRPAPATASSSLFGGDEDDDGGEAAPVSALFSAPNGRQGEDELERYHVSAASRESREVDRWTQVDLQDHNGQGAARLSSFEPSNDSAGAASKWTSG
ncbi:hypothetical protein P8C59_006120 [Phyllachora maydis]|uniref:Transmembrane protein n=1 Tax=Phyllachora maydis TaxID=1825666 RepID=A0AAD9MGA6_9PEZI|nr:hypothetical protein P8C59_006120 [Phyllachora maydis]